MSQREHASAESLQGARVLYGSELESFFQVSQGQGNQPSRAQGCSLLGFLPHRLGEV
jgi:hypothetical protein